MQSASRDSMTLAWITHTGDVWVSSGSKHPSQRVSQTGSSLLAISADGRQVAWVGETEFFTYDVEAYRIERWELPAGLLAIGWRGTF